MEWKEKRKVVMTKDRKCIVRGKSRGTHILCTVDEKSRYKVRDAINTKFLIESINKSVSSLKLSDEVKKLYNTNSCWYSKDKIGELEAVDIECTMKTL